MTLRTLFFATVSVLLLASLAQAQTVGVRGTPKGTSIALGVTSTAVDANHTALDMNIESFFLTIPAGGTTARISADQLYKSGPGTLEYITCYSDVAATAGTIAVRDSTAAGTGDILYEFTVVAAIGYTTPFTVPLRTRFSTGLYLDFTTTADMFCTLVYR